MTDKYKDIEEEILFIKQTLVYQLGGDISNSLDKIFSYLESSKLASVATGGICESPKAPYIFGETPSEMEIRLISPYHEDIKNDELDLIMTVEDFKDDVESGALTDYDGWGYAVNKNNKKRTDINIFASKVNQIPSDATHIIWFNR
jgi:hypothetical protein